MAAPKAMPMAAKRRPGGTANRVPTCQSSQGINLAADDQHQGDEGADFEQGLGDGHPDRAIASARPGIAAEQPPASGGSMTSTST